MASEAVLVLRQEDPIDFIVANGTGIEKGALLALTDPRTGIANSGAGDVLAGIAAREKIASDGRTRLAVYKKGIFRMYVASAIAIGQPVMSAVQANIITAATGVASVSGAAVLGYALEVAAADGETIEVAVNVGTGGLVQ